MRPSAGRSSASAEDSLLLPTSKERLEEFYRDFFLPLVWRATWRNGLAKEDARDVVQEAFLVAVTKLRGEESAKAWLNQVVDNLCANHRRKTFRRARLAAKWGMEGAVVREPAADSGEEQDGSDS